ncbi:MAG: phosphoribosyltransferase family protein [Candidatus Paceibacterota bacterium]
MGLLNTLLDIVFPTNCLSCGVSGVDLCTTCLSSFPETTQENTKWIFPLYDYRAPPVKRALWEFKYKGKKRLAGSFAEILYGKIIEELSELSMMENFNDAILVPIPLSPKRYRERGYNQSELICKELIKLDGNVNFKFKSNVLVKIKETEHQAQIQDKSKRLKNLSDSFAVKESASIRGRNIILIDDIITTGATLTEAKKALRHAGARKIIAFTIAH